MSQHDESQLKPRRPHQLPGQPQARRRTSLDALQDIVHDLTGKDYGPDVDLRLVMELILLGDVTQEAKLSALTSLLKYTRAQLKAVEHSGAVLNLQTELAPKEIEAILARDPFLTAVPVKDETP